ncbi:transcription initiation factor IIB [Halovivax limisalsi]|uniref:transcription initiation factor IIB n=1 Tax=Halovivax limisalsi TaxID=1453760 RepID=UPI001FFD205A|nr:transcription initiation factor IIB family protein [Halovivax limisalsi]
MGDGGDGWCCPECAGRLRPSGTERFCEECGLVVDGDPIDRGPEWRSFEAETRRRTGAPLTRSRHDRGLSTEIGYRAAGRITGRKRTQLSRMRREHARARISTTAKQNQVSGYTEIGRLVGDLSLPGDAREEACRLFETAQTAGLLPGRSVEGFAAACVYATARSIDLPRTMTEVLDEARAEASELKTAYAAMNRELGLPTGPIDPATYLPRFASELDLDADVERQARRYLATLSANDAIGASNPGGVAAACLYRAATERGCDVTQVEAGEVAGVSPVTIRSTVRRVRELA